MADWTTIILKDAINPDRGISYGIVQPGSHITDGVPIIRVSDIRHGRIDTASPIRVHPDIESQHRRTRLRGGELLITIVGTVGETVIVPQDLAGWNVARAVAVLSIRPEIGAYWVQLALRSPSVRAMIDSRLNTTVQATLNLGDLAQLPILMPPPDDRERIGSTIEVFDRKIELNRRMNETLEAMARAIFKDWFVDFGPTRAKMAGTKPYLASEIWNLFPDSLDDEGMPEGWRYGTFRSLCDTIENGGTPSRAALNYWNNGTIPWLTSSEVRKPIVLRTNQLITPEGLKNSSAKVWPPGTTVVAMYGATAGEVCLLGEMISSNQACCGLIPRPSYREYLFISVREAREELASKAVGSAQQNLSQNLVSNNRSLLPTDQVVSAYSSLIGPILDRWIANEGEAETLAATRDLLLPKLMSGEIRVKEATKTVEAELELHL